MTSFRIGVMEAREYIIHASDADDAEKLLRREHNDRSNTILRILDMENLGE